MRDEALGFSRFGKFCLIGLLGAALQTGLVWVFTKHCHLPVVAAAPFAVELILLHNFA